MRNFTLSASILFIAMIVSASTVSVFGQAVKLVPKMYLSAKNTPVGNAGWEVVDVTINNAATDYWKMVKSTSVITSPVIDFSKYTNLVVKIGVGSFGASATTTTECNVRLECFNGTTWDEVTTFGKPASSASNELTQSFVCTHPAGKIRFSTPNASGTVGARLFFVEISGVVFTSQPSVIVSSTIDLGVVQKNVAIEGNLNVKASNLTGALIISTLAPFSTTIGTITKAEAEAASGFEIPVSFLSTSKGTFSGSLTISGGGLTDDVIVTLTASAYELKQIADVTALRSEWTGTEDVSVRYQLTGQSLMTFVNGKNYYIQNDQSGLLVYDKNTLIASENGQIGDKVTGMIGTLADYNGMLELVITDAALNIVSNGNEVVPVEVSTSDFLTHFETYEGRLIRILNLSFASADGSTLFKSSPENLTVTSGIQSLVVRTFASRDYADAIIPGKAHVTGLAVEYSTIAGGTALQLSPRMASDIVEGSTSVIETTRFGNNVFVEDDKLVVLGMENNMVEVYTLTGALVITRVASTNRTEIELPHGIYLVKTLAGTVRIVL